MNLTTAMSNALSGLAAVSRGVDLVSNNTANAGTEGYARRELQLSPLVLGGTGGGVRVAGVARATQPVLAAELRRADAQVAADGARLAFREALAGLIGDGNGEGSLSDGIARLSAALVEASNRPDSTTRLTAAVSAAAALAGQLNAASGAVQQARMEADARIGEAVGWLNAALGQVHDLNAEITRLTGTGRDAAGLLDARDLLVGRIAEWIPVQEIPRGGGQVALATPSGLTLLDSRPAELAFSPAGVITADVQAGGALSTLTVNGKDIAFAAGAGRAGGGRLGALFDIRDGLAVQAQEMLDVLARNLHDRFADPAVDPTLAAGQPGLFTDGGLAASGLAGLAGRLSVNAALDPAQGGAVWRLRDGLNAATEGPAGRSALLTALDDALSAPRAPASGPFGATARSAGALADELSALWSGGTATLESALALSGSRADALRAAQLQNGVDTDAEMQKLLALEQAYGANARVISTIDTLFRQLLGL